MKKNYHLKTHLKLVKVLVNRVKPMLKQLLQLRRTILIICYFAVAFGYFAIGQNSVVALAQTSSKSGSIDVRLEGKDIEDGGSATPNPESINKAINERINKQLNEEQEKKLTNLLDTINQLRRAIFGQVERITDDSLTITTSEGINIIPIPKTVIVKQGSKTIKSSDIAVDDWVIVIGANSNSNSTETTSPSFVPQQITVFTSNPISEQPTVELGIVDTLTKSSVQIVSRSSGQSSTFSILKTTKFQDNKGKPTTLERFEKDITVLVVGVRGEKTNSATIIRSLASFDQREGN